MSRFLIYKFETFFQYKTNLKSRRKNKHKRFYFSVEKTHLFQYETN